MKSTPWVPCKYFQRKLANLLRKVLRKIDPPVRRDDLDDAAFEREMRKILDDLEKYGALTNARVKTRRGRSKLN